MAELVRKVLLAEHDKSIAEILRYLLKAWDFEVISVADGVTMLDLVRQEQPDIIIIDSNLPGIDGLKASKMLKEDFLTAHIPIIILIDKRQIRKRMLQIEQGVDDYIANPPDPIDLEVRIEMALRRTTHQLHANALTRLPGNRQIEKMVRAKIKKKEVFSIAYYDIDNFKSFNDKYGYMKGDGIIRHSAYIISTTVRKFGGKNDFVGHIGGDDFVVLTTPGHDKLIASESILSFNRVMPFHYSKEDRDRGYVISKDRQGNTGRVPLMSVSIAIANNKEHEFQNTVQLMEIIAEIKRYLKTLPGSNFLVNRRDPSKKHRSFATEKESCSGGDGKFPESGYRPLGQILIESSVISSDQLESALIKHWNTGQKIGQSILDLGLARPGDITRALESQLNIPHYDLSAVKENGELSKFVDMISVDFMRERGVVPVNMKKNVLSLAMLNPRDINVINKIRKTTGCNVAAFFVLESEFHEIWKKVVTNDK